MTKKTRAKTRRALLTLSLVLVVAFAAVGGTIAWLTDYTDTITNTFAPSNINIELDETTQKDNNYKFDMVPGDQLDKDPIVTVKAKSEDAWLFVKVEESTELDNYITYNMADGWTAVPNTTNVYYREVTKSESDQTFGVIAGNKVTVKDTVTTDMMEDVYADDDLVTLTFTAYAVQKEAASSAEAAWAIAQDNSKMQVYPGTTPN